MSRVTLNPDGVLRTVRVESYDMKDFRQMLDVQVFYKGKSLTKVRAIELLLAPSEHDEGNKLFLDDLGVSRG